MRLRSIFKSILPEKNTLRGTLALYFIPISVIPVIVISIYATRVFHENTDRILRERAISERDAILGEIQARQSSLVEVAQKRAGQGAFLRAVRTRERDTIEYALSTFRYIRGRFRVYSSGGRFLAGYGKSVAQDIDYLSKQGLADVRRKGITVDRYFIPDGGGFVTLIRVLLRLNGRAIGVLEEEHPFGPTELAALKNRRQVDVVMFDNKLANVAASFALSKELLQSITALALKTESGTEESNTIDIGGERYATFLYNLEEKKTGQRWGYFALFISMTNLDAAVGGLNRTMVTLAFLLVCLASLLIFLFTNQIVKPIVALVNAMKRVKVGRVGQIPDIDSTYEIEYVVRSFNDMARNITETKQALEMKLQELHRANNEIKDTQTTLVQSAKMASLGQIVAGVAHELNNPIGFIYSNMHHLSEYVDRLRELVEAFQDVQGKLPAKEKKRLEKVFKDLEVEFILGDIEDLSKSCLDGAKRVKDIVLGLRTFSRMDEATFQMSDIHESLRSTLKLLTSEFRNRITVHEQFAELPLVECNISQLNQVFMNLLTNAGQAIKHKGEIWITTKRLESSVEIEVEDSGSGIPPAELEKIFDPFFTTKKVGDGTGLGLSIAYGLIQKHNGTIDVQSKIGTGTRFTITLPIKQPKHIAQHAL